MGTSFHSFYHFQCLLSVVPRVATPLLSDPILNIVLIVCCDRSVLSVVLASSFPALYLPCFLYCSELTLLICFSLIKGTFLSDSISNVNVLVGGGRSSLVAIHTSLFPQNDEPMPVPAVIVKNSGELADVFADVLGHVDRDTR